MLTTPQHVIRRSNQPLSQAPPSHPQRDHIPLTPRGKSRLPSRAGRLLPLCALFLMVGCQPKPAQQKTETPAETKTIPVNAAQPSPHFAAVMEHLDIGGKSLHFTDHDGERDLWIGLLELIARMPQAKGTFDRVNPAALVDESGLCSAAASGRSLMKDGDHWLMRHYAHHPGGLPELFGMTGEANDFVLTTLPGATDIAFECRLDASALPKLMRRYAGLTDGAEELENGLKQRLPFGMTVEEILSRSKMDVLLGIEFGKPRREGMPVTPEAFVLRVRTEKPLMAACRLQLEKSMGDAQVIGCLRGWEIPVPSTPVMEGMKPVLLMEGEDTLIAVSSQDYWNTVQGGGDRLGDDPVYRSATDHFPKTGNMQAYLSPTVATSVREWAGLAMSRSRELEELRDVVGKITPGKPWSVCVACGATGVQTIAEMPFALDSSATTVMVGLSATSTLFVGARAWKKGSDRAACILNIRNVQQAVRAHQNIHGLQSGAPLNWTMIFGANGYLKEVPKCPGGGTYTFSGTIPQKGKLACKCSHGHTAEGHEPAKFDDW